MSGVPPEYPQDIRDTFEWCEDCETPVVRRNNHSCTPDTADAPGHLNTAQREQLADDDDRPSDDDVICGKTRSNNGALAYHETEDDGSPLHELQYGSDSRTETRERAKELGFYPCRRCIGIDGADISTDGDRGGK